MKPASGYDLSVVIPAYNEEQRLPWTLERIIGWLETSGYSYEVIVVDDGSSDGTAEIADHVGARVLRLPANRGKGAAVRAGVRASSGERVLVTDADLSTPISDLVKLSKELDQADVGIAIGSRAVRGARISVHQPQHREWMGRMFNLLVRLLVMPGIRDTQCGFKLFNGDLARRVFSYCQVDGFAFDVEVIVLVRRMGLRVCEVPVDWENSVASRVAPVRDSYRMLVEVLRLWRRVLTRSGTSLDGMLASPPGPEGASSEKEVMLVGR